MNSRRNLYQTEQDPPLDQDNIKSEVVNKRLEALGYKDET